MPAQKPRRIKIKFQKLHPDAQAPWQASDEAAACDLTATSRTFIYQPDHILVEYGTGVAIEGKPGFAALFLSRSSVSKTGLLLANAAGLIDPDYRGEIKARFRYFGRRPEKDKNIYQVGDRIGQLLLIPCLKPIWTETKKLSATNRGAGSFGSTGKKGGKAPKA